MLPFSGVYQWIRYDALRITAPRIYALLLTALAALVYVPFLANPLIFDDFNIVNGTNFLDYTFQFWIAPRWLPYATLAHTYALTNGSIVAMRLGNLILHAANVVAVFVLLREICAAALIGCHGEKNNGSRALAVAALGAALLAVHPVAVYGVGYLIQRTILMSTLFMLLMLISYLRWLIAGRNALWVWSVVWYALSVLSKEHSIMAPSMALLMSFLLHRPSLPLCRRMIVPFAAYAIVALLMLLMVKGVLGAAYEPMALDMLKDVQGSNAERVSNAYSLSVVTQSSLYFKYLFLWLFPDVNWMSVDMRAPFATSALEWPYSVAAFAFVAYIVGAVSMVLRGGRVGIAGWILACPWLMFATELSTVRVQEPFVLYRAYLWFPLLGALAPLALCRLNVRITAMVAVPVLCLLTALSWNRLNTLSDTLIMWEDAAKLLVRGDEMGAARIYYNRALALSQKGRKQEALVDLNRVVELQPNLGPVYNARAKVYFELKLYTKALRDLNDSIRLDPRNSAVLLARAMTLQRLGREDEALPDLQRSCELKDIVGCYVLHQKTNEASTKQ